MLEINKHEIRSLEMQEVMSAVPSSFLKWGLFLFFSFLLILIVGSYFVKKPEIVSVPVIIITQNPPVTLIAKTGGRIEKMFAIEGALIEKDQIVAIISNTSDLNDIEKLSNFLSGFSDKTDWKTIIQVQSFPSDLKLGEIQPEYSRFEKAWKQMKDYLEQAYIPSKLAILKKQIKKKIEYSKELAIQKEYYLKDIDLARNNSESDSLLFNNFYKSISATEYDQLRQNYIFKLNLLSIFNAFQILNESEFLRIQELEFDLKFQFKKEVTQYILTMEESLQLLKSAISSWEEKYLIKTPIPGRITLTRFRNDNQVIKSGETLATMIPANSANIIARGVIQASGFSRIEIGQEVNIKLAGFPYLQYGILKGRIYSISQVPGDDGFIIDIELTQGLTSTYGNKIKFINQMNGTAEIITKESRLIFTFIHGFKSLSIN